jgi:ubiquinone/menaquinone biosynthesis C-methylase UbiE
MNHQDHMALLREGIAQPGGVWADLGAGQGAFTLALAELIGPGGTIYAVDKNGRDLNHLEKSLKKQFPQTTLHILKADFSSRLNLPVLNGIIMANSLHFVPDKDVVLQQCRGYLKPDGRLLLVEYNVDKGNRWVPYPLSFETWATVAKRNGFGHTQKLAAYPSRFLGEIYAAMSQV